VLIVTRFASGAGTACIYLPGWETTNEALPPCQTTVIAPVRLDELEFLSTVYVIVAGLRPFLGLSEIHGVAVSALHEQPFSVFRVTVKRKLPPPAGTLCADGDKL